MHFSYFSLFVSYQRVFPGWGQVVFTRVDEDDVQIINSYEWTTF